MSNSLDLKLDLMLEQARLQETFYILQEDGFKILQEDGTRLLTENA